MFRIFSVLLVECSSRGRAYLGYYSIESLAIFRYRGVKIHVSAALACWSSLGFTVPWQHKTTLGLNDLVPQHLNCLEVLRTIVLRQHKKWDQGSIGCPPQSLVCLLEPLEPLLEPLRPFLEPCRRPPEFLLPRRPLEPPLLPTRFLRLTFNLVSHFRDSFHLAFLWNPVPHAFLVFRVLVGAFDAEDLPYQVHSSLFLGQG